MNLPGESPVRGRSTIIDVARLSGVAPATVSKALDVTGRYGLSDEVRRRVVEAADRLNYRSRSHGRRPLRSKFRLVGLIHGKTNPITETPGPVLRAMTDALAARDHHLIHFSGSGDVSNLNLSLPSENRIAGWLGLGEISETLETAFVGLGQPVVLLNGAVDCALSQVSSNEGQAADLLVRHLFDLGHQRIAMCVAAEIPHAIRLARIEGYRAAMRRLGLQDNSVISANSAELLARPSSAIRTRPTAIIADTLNTAIELLEACRAREIRVPETISIASFDDRFPAEKMAPSITAVHPRLEQAATEAVNLLLDQIEARQSTLPRKVLVGATLAVRRSTGPPGAEALAKSA